MMTMPMTMTMPLPVCLGRVWGQQWIPQYELGDDVWQRGLGRGVSQGPYEGSERRVAQRVQVVVVEV